MYIQGQADDVLNQQDLKCDALETSATARENLAARAAVVAVLTDAAVINAPVALPRDTDDDTIPRASIEDMSSASSDATAHAQAQCPATPKTPKMRKKTLRKAVRTMSIDLDTAHVLQDEQAQELFVDLLQKTKMVRSESRQNVRETMGLIAENKRNWRSVGDLTLGVLRVAKHHKKQDRTQEFEDFRRQSINSSLSITDVEYWDRYCQILESVFAVVKHSKRRQLPPGCRLHMLDHQNLVLRAAYAICVDDYTKSVVLCLRGTRSLADVITDMAAKPTAFEGGFAHEGMLHSAKFFTENKFIKTMLRRLLEKHDGYRLRVCGHSLGGSVSVLVGYIWRKVTKEFPDLEVVSIATPCVLSLGLAEECEDWTTSIIQGDDIVPRLSLATAEVLRQEVEAYPWKKEVSSKLKKTVLGRAVLKGAKAVKKVFKHKRSEQGESTAGGATGTGSAPASAPTSPRPHPEPSEEMEEDSSVSSSVRSITNSVSLRASVPSFDDMSHIDTDIAIEICEQSASATASMSIDATSATSIPTSATASSLSGSPQKMLNSSTDESKILRHLYPAGRLFHVRRIGESVYARLAEGPNFERLIFTGHYLMEHTLHSYHTTIGDLLKIITILRSPPVSPKASQGTRKLSSQPASANASPVKVPSIVVSSSTPVKSISVEDEDIVISVQSARRKHPSRVHTLEHLSTQLIAFMNSRYDAHQQRNNALTAQTTHPAAAAPHAVFDRSRHSASFDNLDNTSSVRSSRSSSLISQMRASTPLPSVASSIAAPTSSTAVKSTVATHGGEEGMDLAIELDTDNTDDMGDFVEKAWNAVKDRLDKSTGSAGSVARASKPHSSSAHTRSELDTSVGSMYGGDTSSDSDLSERVYSASKRMQRQLQQEQINATTQRKALEAPPLAPLRIDVTGEDGTFAERVQIVPSATPNCASAGPPLLSSQYPEIVLTPRVQPVDDLLTTITQGGSISLDVESNTTHSDMTDTPQSTPQRHAQHQVEASFVTTDDEFSETDFHPIVGKLAFSQIDEDNIESSHNDDSLLSHEDHDDQLDGDAAVSLLVPAPRQQQQFAPSLPPPPPPLPLLTTYSAPYSTTLIVEKEQDVESQQPKEEKSHEGRKKLLKKKRKKSSSSSKSNDTKSSVADNSQQKQLSKKQKPKSSSTKTEDFSTRLLRATVSSSLKIRQQPQAAPAGASSTPTTQAQKATQTKSTKYREDDRLSLASQSSASSASGLFRTSTPVASVPQQTVSVLDNLNDSAPSVSRDSILRDIQVLERQIEDEVANFSSTSTPGTSSTVSTVVNEPPLSSIKRPSSATRRAMTQSFNRSTSQHSALSFATTSFAPRRRASSSGSVLIRRNSFDNSLFMAHKHENAQSNNDDFVPTSFKSFKRQRYGMFDSQTRSLDTFDRLYKHALQAQHLKESWVEEERKKKLELEEKELIFHPTINPASKDFASRSSMFLMSKPFQQPLVRQPVPSKQQDKALMEYVSQQIQEHSFKPTLSENTLEMVQQHPKRFGRSRSIHEALFVEAMDRSATKRLLEEHSEQISEKDAKALLEAPVVVKSESDMHSLFHRLAYSNLSRDKMLDQLRSSIGIEKPTFQPTINRASEEHAYRPPRSGTEAAEELYAEMNILKERKQKAQEERDNLMRQQSRPFKNRKDEQLWEEVKQKHLASLFSLVKQTVYDAVDTSRSSATTATLASSTSTPPARFFVSGTQAEHDAMVRSIASLISKEDVATIELFLKKLELEHFNLDVLALDLKQYADLRAKEIAIQRKQPTFQPKIDKNSKNMVAKSLLLRPDGIEHLVKKKLEKVQRMKQQLEQREMKECTHIPKVNKPRQPKDRTTSQNTTRTDLFSADVSRISLALPATPTVRARNTNEPMVAAVPQSPHIYQDFSSAIASIIHETEAVKMRLDNNLHEEPLLSGHGHGRSASNTSYLSSVSSISSRSRTPSSASSSPKRYADRFRR